MGELKIHFDNAREAQDITGKRFEYLARIEEALGVRLTARDTWLQAEGDPEKAAAALRFVELLRSARNAGIGLREHTVLFALRAFQEGREQELARLHACRIDVSPGKSPIFPRTFGQQSYVEAIRGTDISFGIGPAGTGKTYLAMAMAVSTLLRNEVSRIILTRPAVEAGEALGFLPGDMHQKVLPYLRPLYDALYDMMTPDDIERNMLRGIIEVAPLAYMRGRTLNHAFVILDEAQNTTPEQMLMFLTRLGFDSKCVITGDLTQVDLPPYKTSGLLEARRTLRGVDGIAIIELTDSDVVRHELVQKIIQAYREAREAAPPPAEQEAAK
ncbi:MAG: PhoH family protein [Kiritimatiellae bacterium]|nr:PhoH family protein [Kiritimatiellia bacterium]